MPAKFHLPDFWIHGQLNLALIDMIQSHPERFYDGVGIASVYGCFPPAIWNGGRNINGCADEKTITHVLNEFNSRGIPCRFTFTNPLITEEHINDKFCNRLLELADNGLNECIVNTPVLEEHIRKNFPNYKLTSSTCKQIRELDALKEEIAKDYSLVVLDYNWNNQFDVLEQLPSKERLEILVCPYCFPNCQRRGEHYRYLGEQQLRRSLANSFGGAMGLHIVNEKPFPCEAPMFNFLETTKLKTHITADDLHNKYVPMGYSQFKIEGRTIHPLNVIESYVYYMAKPEYKDIVRLELGLAAFKMN
ncbi:MAG: hypothetical protein ACI4JJ_06405 [Huintestinicola sp.]